jgi:YHS domain-containing protein
MCKEQFKKAPAKFATAANHQLVLSGQAKQVNCPISGSKPAMGCGFAYVSNVGGVKIAFSSEECKKKVDQAKPAEQLELVFGNAAFARGFAVTKAARPQQKTSTATEAKGCCCVP